MDNDQQNVNGVMILTLLKEQNKPLTASEMMHHIARESGFKEEELRESIMNTLEGGECFGFLEKHQGKYSYKPGSLIQKRNSSKTRKSAQKVVPKSRKAKSRKVGRKSSGRIVRKAKPRANMRRSLLKAMPTLGKASLAAKAPIRSPKMRTKVQKPKPKVSSKSSNKMVNVYVGVCKRCMRQFPCLQKFSENKAYDDVTNLHFLVNLVEMPQLISLMQTKQALKVDSLFDKSERTQSKPHDECEDINSESYDAGEEQEEKD